jgi:hypothetical protein
MLLLAAGLLGELLLLYLISRILIEHIYAFFFLISRSRPVAVSLITFLTFPGTVIHELSHLFTAEILGVKTGGLRLTPEAIQETEVRAGSVMIAKTDPFRRTLIGTAPFFSGIIAITALSYYLTPQITGTWDALMSGSGVSAGSLLLLLAIIYLMFAVSNSMFSSKEDMKGFPVVAIFFALIIATMYMVGVRISLTGRVESFTEQVLSSLTQSLGIVLALNIILLLLTRFLVVLTGKITRRRIVSE